MRKLFSLLILSVFGACLAQEPIQLTPESVVRFATPEEGATILGSSDDFSEVMSQMDLNIRMGKSGASKEEWLEFAASQTLPWTDEEKTRLTKMMEQVASKLTGLTFSLPNEVMLIKTTGEEEFGGDALYTRQNAIVIIQSIMDAPVQELPEEELTRILAHELYHVLSRATPNKKDEAYAVIGFKPCKGFVLPEPLIQVTNPDAPLTEHSIEAVSKDGQALQGVFVIFAQEPNLDFAKLKAEGQGPGELLASGVIKFGFLPVDTSTGNCSPLLEGDLAKVYDLEKDVTGVFEKIGKNTGYIIHPEEILAENFSFIVTGAEVPNPEITTKLTEVLGLQ
jgi:hypothetical protein